MKKVIKPIVLMSSLLLLAACDKGESSKTVDSDDIKVTVSVKPKGEKAEEKQVVFDKDDSVMDALEEG